MFTKTQTSADRQAVWRNFRQQFDHHTQTAHDVVAAFASAKPLRRCIDYYTPEDWPLPFEIVAENMLCQSGLTLVMASTLLNLRFTNSKSLQFDAISNHITGAEGLVFVDNGLVYNFLPGEIVSVDFAKKNSTVYCSHIITSDKLGR
jgi:hypothetical protein